MTVRHIALFRFADGTADADVDRVTAALLPLADTIEGLRDYRVGPDLGLSDDTWDYAVVADLDDAEAYERYRTDPAHLEVVREIVRPLISERASVQYMP